MLHCVPRTTSTVSGAVEATSRRSKGIQTTGLGTRAVWRDEFYRQGPRLTGGCWSAGIYGRVPCFFSVAAKPNGKALTDDIRGDGREQGSDIRVVQTVAPPAGFLFDFSSGFCSSAWATLAVYYSNLPWAWLRLVLAAGFAAFSVWSIWIARRPRMRLGVLGLLAIVVVWFISIRPSHDRPWRPEVAVMPRAIIDGDRVRLTGFRNFDYKSRDDFTVRYEEREVSLAHLTSVDLFIGYRRVGPVGHTFVSFNFDNAPRVHLDRNAAGGGRRLRADRLDVQAI